MGSCALKSRATRVSSGMEKRPGWRDLSVFSALFLLPFIAFNLNSYSVEKQRRIDVDDLVLYYIHIDHDSLVPQTGIVVR